MPHVAVGADDRTTLTDRLLQELERRGFDMHTYGPIAGRDEQWAEVGELVGRDVAAGRAEFGIACCHTGTGVSMAANKVPGVRAALCKDAETARGARAWNDANVLCIALASTTEEELMAILNTWLDYIPVDEEELPSINRLAELDRAR
jgi:ribose 5-phosphate isomerase B